MSKWLFLEILSYTYSLDESYIMIRLSKPIAAFYHQDTTQNVIEKVFLKIKNQDIII